MNNKFLNIITRLLNELNLDAAMFSLAGYSKATTESKNIILVRRGNLGDYFLLAEIEYFELEYVNRDLQTSIMLQLQDLLSETGTNNFQHLSGITNFKINSDFEKNTTLLLFIQKRDDINSLLYEIAEVEEDEYFFKKQVVTLSTKFLDNLDNAVSSSTDFEITRYLQDCMNDTEQFKKFMKIPNDNIDYAGCAQLFEKFPFLHLSVQSSESNSLQKMIDGAIEKHSEKYSIKIEMDNEDKNCAFTVFDKNLKEINEIALDYVSKAEESGAQLDAESLLINLQGKWLNE